MLHFSPRHHQNHKIRHFSTSCINVTDFRKRLSLCYILLYTLIPYLTARQIGASLDTLVSEGLGCRRRFPLLGVSFNQHGVTLKNAGKLTKCKDYNLNKGKTRVKINHRRIRYGLCRCFAVPPVLQLHKLPPVRTVLPPSAAGVLPWWPTCSRWQRMDDPETESPPTGWTSPWVESPPTVHTPQHNITAYI